jgi:hypothetical protein
MAAPKFRMFAAMLAGIGFGLALGFGIAFAFAETRVVDGVAQYVVQYEADLSESSEGTFPAGLVPHRVVKTHCGTSLVESQAADFGLCMGLLYAICGAIVGIALACGADASKVLASGVISAAAMYFLFSAFLNAPTEKLSAVAMLALLALMVACGEAIHSATAMQRKRRPRA